MSNFLRRYGLQHTRRSCPSLSPRVCSDSCPLSWWCYLTISSSAALFSFCLQHFPASGSLPMSWLFTSCGQSIGASASITPMTIQGWFPKYSLLIHLQTLRQKYNSCLTKFKHWIIIECILSDLLPRAMCPSSSIWTGALWVCWVLSSTPSLWCPSLSSCVGCPVS